MATQTKRPQGASKRSGNPARRAAVDKRSPEDGLSLWVKIFLLINVVSSLGLSLWFTWGFQGAPQPAALLLSGVISALTLSAAAFFLEHYIYAPQAQKRGRPAPRRRGSAKQRMQRSVVVLLALVLSITVLAGAFGGPSNAPKDEKGGLGSSTIKIPNDNADQPKPRTKNFKIAPKHEPDLTPKG